MEHKRFSQCRKKLDKTQQQMADILGVSVKSIRSYEQGVRNIPAQMERQVYFLLSKRRGKTKQANTIPCWEVQQCNKKEKCPVWEFQCGDLCWFLCGTLCTCTEGLSPEDKIAKCTTCSVLKSQIR